MFNQTVNYFQPAAPVPVMSYFVKTVDAGSLKKTQLVRAEVNEVTVPDLPSPENFTVEAYKRAGIDLKRVNTSVLGSLTQDTDVSDKVTNIMDSLDPQDKTVE